MPSRRSFLSAVATGAVTAVAGCVDRLPWTGSEESPGLAESFLAEPSLVPVVDGVDRAVSASATVQHFDASIAEHAEELGTRSDFDTFGKYVVPTWDGGGGAIESVDHAVIAKYNTTWVHQDDERSPSLEGAAEGYVGYLNGSYDRAAYEDAEITGGSFEERAEGYDLYRDGEGDALGFSEDEILTGHHWRQNYHSRYDEKSTPAEKAMALLHRGVRRSRNGRSLPEWAQPCIDAVTPAHNLLASIELDRENEKRSLEAVGVHVDGPETTISLAMSVADPANLEEAFWTDGPGQDRIFDHVATLAGYWLNRTDGAQKILLDGPTVSTGDRHVEVRCTMPSASVEDPDLAEHMFTGPP